MSEGRARNLWALIGTVALIMSCGVSATAMEDAGAVSSTATPIDSTTATPTEEPVGNGSSAPTAPPDSSETPTTTEKPVATEEPHEAIATPSSFPIPESAMASPSEGCYLGSCFGNTRAGKWIAANSWRYGFIVRYPQGYTHVIGFIWEPWHVRYVGVDVATAMRNRGDATYEQYLGVPAAPKY